MEKFCRVSASDYESPHGKVSVIFNIRQVICRNIAFLTRLESIFRLSSANRGQKSTTFRKNKGAFFQKQRTFFRKSRGVLNWASRRNPVAAQRRPRAPHLRAFRRGAPHSHPHSPCSQPGCAAPSGTICVACSIFGRNARASPSGKNEKQHALRRNPPKHAHKFKQSIIFAK